MEDRKGFNPDDLLERAVDAVLRDPIPGELPPDRVAQLVATVRQAADRPYPITLIERIKSMKPTTRIAVAAAVLIAFLGLISLFVPGGGATLAFADVAEALNSVHSATWKAITVTRLKPPGEKEEKTVTMDTNCMFLAPSHERTEFTSDGGKSKAITIVDGRKDKVITLVPATKTATVISLKNFSPQNSPYGKTFQGLRELAANAQSGKAGKVERLGVKTIDGRTAEGFRIQQGALITKIWADPKTLLPIRVENIFEAYSDINGNTTMTDFRFNVPLDESLFALEIPPGYNVQQTAEIDASKPWAFLTGALKLAAECNDGVFPPALRGEQGIVSVIQRGALTLAERHKGSPDELRKLATDIAMNVAGFSAFVSVGPQDAYHYAGKDVKLGTPNRPIFWFQRKRDGRCMVIYADLSVKEVPADEAPTLPESEGGSAPQGTESKPSP